MNETNESWLNRLTSSGSVRDDTIAVLRALLISRLRKTFASRSGVDDGILDDVVQDALIKTLESLDQFRGNSLFTTWATTIAIRVALTELRRRRWKDVSLDRLLTDAGIEFVNSSETNSGQHENICDGAIVQSMYHFIETDLTDKQRTALLAELKGMPQEEIGRRMGSNRNAIYKLTHDARKRLKKSLESAGYTAADLQTT
jgi:RNA polymerase sigma-70 factor (ECF subfamily)